MYSVFLRLLKERGIKASDVSKATGIPQSTFSDWKKGRSKPKDEKMQKIADYFGVPVQYLRTGKPAPVFKVSAGSIQSSYELLQKMHPDVIMDDKARQMMALVDKYEQLSDNDKDEIMTLIDLKLDRYKKKEKKDLA